MTYEEQKQRDQVVIIPWHSQQQEEIIRRAMSEKGMTYEEALLFAESAGSSSDQG